MSDAPNVDASGDLGKVPGSRRPAGEGAAAASPTEEVLLARQVAVYASLTERFLSDNNRIWTTAATMIPLSLGAFVVLASIHKPTLAQIITLSAAAWVLMSIWYVIAENHRAFQDRSMERMRTLEKSWKVEEITGGPKGGDSRLTAPGRVRQMRTILWLAVTVTAILAIVLWPGGIVSHVG